MWIFASYKHVVVNNVIKYNLSHFDFIWSIWTQNLQMWSLNIVQKLINWRNQTTVEILNPLYKNPESYHADHV